MHDETVRYRSLGERLRTCWIGQGMTFSYPPATEEQLRATEDDLGYPLPPLLRMIYGEVANGGVGLLDYELPLIGARGGCPVRPIEKSEDGRWLNGPTVEKLVSRSEWRPHPCIEAALRRHPECYVVCSIRPDGFVSIMDIGSQGYELDLVSGRIYESWYYGDLPLDDNQLEPLLEVSFRWPSLEEMVEEHLARMGCGDASAQRMHRPSSGGYHELTSNLLTPACEADSEVVWRGLYRGTWDIIHPSEPDDEW